MTVIKKRDGSTRLVIRLTDTPASSLSPSLSRSLALSLCLTFSHTHSLYQVRMNEAGGKVAGISYTDSSGQKQEMEDIDACVLALGPSSSPFTLNPEP